MLSNQDFGQVRTPLTQVFQQTFRWNDISGGFHHWGYPKMNALNIGEAEHKLGNPMNDSIHEISHVSSMNFINSQTDDFGGRPRGRPLPRC